MHSLRSLIDLCLFPRFSTTETSVPPQRYLVAGPPEYLHDDAPYNPFSTACCMRYPSHPFKSSPPKDQSRLPDSRRSSTSGYRDHHTHNTAAPPYLASQEGVSVHGAAVSKKMKPKQKKILPKKRLWQSYMERNSNSKNSKLRSETASHLLSTSTSNYSTENSGKNSTQMFGRIGKLTGASSLLLDAPSSLPVDSFSQKRKFSSSAPHLSGDRGAFELPVISKNNRQRFRQCKRNTIHQDSKLIECSHVQVDQQFSPVPTTLILRLFCLQVCLSVDFERNSRNTPPSNEVEFDSLLQRKTL